MESVRLLFKQFKEDDFHLYFQLSGNDQVMARIAGKGLSKEAAEKRFAEVIELNAANPEIGFYYVIDKIKNEFIGLGKVETKKNAYEIGYALLEKYWRQGYGSEISLKLVAHARSIPYIKSVFAIINPENIPSKIILLKCGFELENEDEYKGQPSQQYRLVF